MFSLTGRVHEAFSLNSTGRGHLGPWRKHPAVHHESPSAARHRPFQIKRARSPDQT
jgi:hypothetical protein